MKILALITARGGSKRLPGKNILMLGDKPLIAWSINVAKDIPEICDVLVSTDDPAIAAVSSQTGAYVPWLRPAELATDTASSVDVALHALNWYEAAKGAVDGLLLLQPTSPFRSKKTVLKGIELYVGSGFRPILGVSSTPAHSMWTMKIESGYLVPILQEHGLGIRSQDLPKEYVANGSFYLISPRKLREENSFITRETIPLIADSPQEELDIDTEWDWFVANCLIRKDQSI